MEPIPCPAVSVVIPTLQRREQLTRAVASVLGQWFQDFELIVVDGGSTDGTAQAMAELGERVRYAYHPTRGVSAARNAGIRLARAPLVAFLDSDNRWLPDHLAILSTALAQHPEAVLASSCPGYRLSGRQRPDQARLVDTWSNPFGSPGYVSCVTVRRDALEAIGGFDETILVGEDTDLWLRLASRGSFCFVQRRTIVKEHTRGGLKERGLRSGRYLDVEERRARAVLRELERRGASADDPMLREARGRLHLMAALRAVGRGEEAAARAGLADACAAQPDFSHRPVMIARRLGYIAERVFSDRLQHADRLQSLWPSSGSDTALYLRAYAAALTLRAGRPRRAARLLLGCIRPTTPGFAIRMVPTLLPELRRWVYRRLHWEREAPDLGPAAAVTPSTAVVPTTGAPQDPDSGTDERGD